MDLEIATVHDALNATKSDTSTWFHVAKCRFYVFYHSEKKVEENLAARAGELGGGAGGHRRG